MIGLKSKKDQLLKTLVKKGLLWSYNPARVAYLADDIIIEHTLAFGDVPELQALFTIFLPEEIKKVWLGRLVPDERYHKSNRYLGLFFFDIQDIDQFLTRYADANPRMEKLRLLAASDEGSIV